MMFEYPYPYHDAAEFETIRGMTVAEVRALVANVTGPIVEIGGPSDEGFRYVSGVKLQTKPIITNVIKGSLYADEPAKAAELDSHIDQLVDGRQLPYADNSLGMVLMSFMSITDETGVQLDEAGQLTDEQQQDAARRYGAADAELARYAAGELQIDEITHAQRLQIDHEIYRALEIGGLFVTNVASDDELRALERIGFEQLSTSFTQDDNGRAAPRDAVLRKR